jgi:hypothetical protein
METKFWSEGLKRSVTPLRVDGGFLFKFDGHSVVALRLSSNVSSQLSGQGMKTEGIKSHLRAKLRRSSEADRWLTLTIVDNPLLEQLGRFRGLVAEGLSNAVGMTIDKRDLVIAATVPVNGVDEQTDQTVRPGDEERSEQQFVDL